MRFFRVLPAVILGGALILGSTSAYAGSFVDNEFVTLGQGAWGANPNGQNFATVLTNQFDTVFAPVNDLLEIGIPGTAGFSIIFDEASAIIAFLPAQGQAGVLTADLLNPASSASGVFGGEVLTLALNLAFSDANLITHPTGVPFGDLFLTGLTGADAQFNGMSVRDLLPIMNTILGGGTGPGIDPSDAFTLTNEVDMAFNGGPVSTFATTNLELPRSDLNATPLPATLPLFASGLGALGLLARWNRRESLSQYSITNRRSRSAFQLVAFTGSSEGVS